MCYSQAEPGNVTWKRTRTKSCSLLTPACPLRVLARPRRSRALRCSFVRMLPLSSRGGVSRPMADKLKVTEENNRAQALFDLTGRVAVITGGAGLLGTKHAEIIAAAGGSPVLLDLPQAKPEVAAAVIAKRYGVDATGLATDITQLAEVEKDRDDLLTRFGRVDILINNAANNPKVESGGSGSKVWSRLENFPLEIWNDDLRVGLTGAFLCSRVFGSEMAKQGKGVILNIASDLAVIAPDQRLYRQPGLPEDEQPVKPVTYSVVKTGLIGLTRYLA